MEPMHAGLSARTATLAAVCASAFLVGRVAFSLVSSVPLRPAGTLALTALVFGASLELVRTGSRWIGPVLAAVLVGLVLGTVPLAEALAASYVPTGQLLWFPLSRAWMELASVAPIPLYIFLIVTGLLDLILMMLWFMLSAVASGLLKSVAPHLGTLVAVLFSFVFLRLVGAVIHRLRRP